MFTTQWLKNLRSLVSRKPATRKRLGETKPPRIEQLEDRALLASQVVTAMPATQAVVPGNAVSIDVQYSTLDDQGNPAQEQATALGLRFHYNSSVLTFNNLSNVFPTGLTAQADQLETLAESDGDPDTDRFINVAWFDFGGNWPGAANTQPLDLYTANFTTAAGFTGTTTLNFTRSATPAGFPDFVSNSPTVTEFVAPDISINDAADVTEGGNSVFTVSLSANPSAVVTVDYSTANNTTSADDFTAQTNQTLTFSPGGALTQNITVATTQDGNVEPDETFFVNLTGATNGNITDNQGVGTILNDDLPEASVADAGIVTEGGDAIFVVSLDQAPLADVDVTLSTADGTAAAPGDFTPISGQVLTFSPGGALTQQVTVTTIDDAVSEADEEFTLEIDSVTGGTESPTAGTGTATISANDPPVIDIADAGSVSEGGIATFIVSLDQAPGVNLTVDYTTVAGTATLVDDFEVTTGTLTFTPTGALTQVVTVQTVQDTLVEQDEDFSVALSNPGNGIIGTSSGSATILDDDVPTISVSDAATVAEGSDAVFTVSLDQAPVATVMVTVGTSDGSATDPDDYTAVSGLVLTFNPGGDLTQNVTVSTVDDTALEFDEDFFLDLSSPVGATISDNQGQAIITSDDVPAVSVSDAADVAEGTDAVFVVLLDTLPLTGQDLTVDVVTADGTALDGSDYTGGTQSLTFTSTGTLTQQVTVSTTDDLLVEPDETFSVSLTNVANGTISSGSANVTITSEDVPAVSISDAPAVAEGLDAVFTVSLDQAPLADVTIDVASSDDSAVAPDDYTSLPTQTLTFTPTGPLTQTVAVTTIDDSLVEADESFFLDASNPAGVSIAVGQGLATITSADQPTVSIADSPDTPEGQLALFSVSVDQEPLAGQNLTVDLTSAGGTAEDGVDYDALSLTLTFTNGGPLTHNVLVATTDDTSVEADETFAVDLSNVAGGSIGTSQGQAVIQDNDFPAVSIDDISVPEGNDAVFTVSLDQAPVADVTVTVSTFDDTAVSPDDFTAAADVVLTFSPGGDITQQVTVATIDDSLVESSEDFFLEITDLSGGMIADGQGIGTITNNDFPSISISDSADVTEGGDAVFTVSLDQAPLAGMDLTVDVATADGTADASDYTAVSQTLTFTSSDPLTQTVAVSTTDDITVELSEDFVLDLNNPGNGSIADGQGSAIILDNDLPTVSIDDAFADEGQDVVFTVSLDQAPVTTLTFTVSTTDGTATSPDDFTAIAGQTVTFDPGGALTQQISVTTVDDTDLEQNETFTVDISNPNNVNIGDGAGEGTIQTNDGPSISISDATLVSEGQAALFTVSIDQAPLPGQDVFVDLTTMDGTAVVGADYNLLAATLTFTSNDPLTQQVAVQTVDDLTVEPDENFSVVLSNPINGAIADNSGEGTIQSDDFPALSISDAPVTSEGSDAVFTVSLDQAPASTVTVTYSTADGAATAPDDYTAVSNQSLTFNPGGALSQDISITTVDDSAAESSESFFVNLLSATGATFNDTQGETIISANDEKVVLDTVDRFPATNRPTLTWQAVAGATDYEVWLTRRFPSEAQVFASESIVSDTSFTPSADLTPGFYKLWVRQLNGEWSDEQTFEIKPTLRNPVAPTFDARPLFEWDAIPQAPGYEIFIRTVTGDIRVTDITGLNFRPNVDLATGPIRWWIRASDAIGNRGWSDVGEKGVRARLTAPVGSTTNTTPTFEWLGVDGASRYILVVMNTDTNTVVLRNDNVTGTTFTASNQLSGGNYRFWVKAINGATNSFSDGLWSRSADFSITAVEEEQPEPSELLFVSLSTLQTTEESETPANESVPIVSERSKFVLAESRDTTRDAAEAVDLSAPNAAETSHDSGNSTDSAELDQLMADPQSIADLMIVG